MRKATRWSNIIAIFVGTAILNASLPLLPSRVAAHELTDACIGVSCGMGSCRASPGRAFGFMCDCEPGWTQFRVNPVDDPFGFLPCIIPNCTFNYACYNESLPQPPRVPDPNNYSIFDPCFWSYCGAGDCVRTRGFKHRCECRKGFGNILNFTSFPCVKDCAVGADCADLGFPLSNGSLPPSPTNFVRSGVQDSSSQMNFSWLFLCATSLAMIQAKWMKL